MKIVLLGRDESYVKGLRYCLQQAGHKVLVVDDAADLPAIFKRETPDLLLADQELIEIAGVRPFDVSSARSSPPMVLPFRYFTASPAVPKPRDDAPNQVFDDTHRRQVEAITNRLRRLGHVSAARVRIGSLAIDFDRKSTAFGGQPLKLTPLQFRLLSALALSARRVVSHQELLELAWGFEGDNQEARELLKVQINRIRQKMKLVAPQLGDHIHASRGFGYMLAPPTVPKRGKP